MFFKIFFLFFLLFFAPIVGYAQNDFNPKNSFTRAKNLLLDEVYFDYKKTVYCQADFNDDREIIPPKGFNMAALADRSERVEVEHIVPAENFGKSFSAWTEGHPLCVTRNKKKYKGRRCAEKANPLYRKMQTDLYNLYPAIGSINAIRENMDFGHLSEIVPSYFGSCPFKLENETIEPPQIARGIIARAYLYFNDTYAPFFVLSPQKKELMEEWNLKYPVDKWECIRTFRIEIIQENENTFVKQACIQKGLWPDHQEKNLFLNRLQKYLPKKRIKKTDKKERI